MLRFALKSSFWSLSSSCLSILFFPRRIKQSILWIAEALRRWKLFLITSLVMRAFASNVNWRFAIQTCRTYKTAREIMRKKKKKRHNIKCLHIDPWQGTTRYKQSQLLSIHSTLFIHVAQQTTAHMMMLIVGLRVKSRRWWRKGEVGKSLFPLGGIRKVSHQDVNRTEESHVPRLLRWIGWRDFN